MTLDAQKRYLQRLPTLITFYFSVMLVTVFRELSVVFAWTTAPVFFWVDLRHALIALSFAATLFFVVSVWLSYSLLIERFPYTLDYAVFYFDVVRFSVLFAVFNHAFLAGSPGQYGYYLAMLALFHLLMAGWHGYRLRHIQGVERRERAVDVRGHIVRTATYGGLAVAYQLSVVQRDAAAEAWAPHGVIVLLTSALLVYWSARRLHDMKTKATAAAEAAAPAATPTAATG